MSKQRGLAGHARISVVARNPELLDLASRALQTGCKLPVESLLGSLEQHVNALSVQTPTLLVLELQPPYVSELAFLERVARNRNDNGASVIVIGGGLDESSTRALLRLSVADWLPSGSAIDELVDSARRVLQAAQLDAVPTGAMIVSFIPVIGGAGASTLATAALEVQTRDKRAKPSDCCIVDLNFENGTIADYLDVPPLLNLDEIVAGPERLDDQLLGVMLSNHKSGYGVLAATNRLSVDPRVDGQIVGRLLDLVASRFRYVVIDLPSNWMSWSEILLHGSDKFYFVTDMSVTGLRHARRVAETISTRYATELNGSVIVNKTEWLSGTGISTSDAKEVLGPFLAGFIPHGGKHVQVAQNHGQLLSGVKRRSALIGGLAQLILGK